MLYVLNVFQERVTPDLFYHTFHLVVVTGNIHRYAEHHLQKETVHYALESITHIRFT